MRPNGRESDQMRPIIFTPDFTKHAEGSVLAEFGDTRVLCTASVEARVPPWMRGAGCGWITGEYGMLPRATHSRSSREASRGKQSGRTVEIQRLIGRSLRVATDLEALGEKTITLDCDVLQADGGTRTAAISGAYIALMMAMQKLQKNGQLKKNPVRDQIAAVSVGIYQGTLILDLDYEEDSQAEMDMNIVMNEAGRFVEIQGTAERNTFTHEELDVLLELARVGTNKIIKAQNVALTKL